MNYNLGLEDWLGVKEKEDRCLSELSSTFASSYDKLAEVIGSDFVECAINVIKQR